MTLVRTRFALDLVCGRRRAIQKAQVTFVRIRFSKSHVTIAMKLPTRSAVRFATCTLCAFASVLILVENTHAQFAQRDARLRRVDIPLSTTPADPQTPAGAIEVPRPRPAAPSSTRRLRSPSAPVSTRRASAAPVLTGDAPPLEPPIARSSKPIEPSTPSLDAPALEPPTGSLTLDPKPSQPLENAPIDPLDLDRELPASGSSLGLEVIPDDQPLPRSRVETLPDALETPRIERDRLPDDLPEEFDSDSDASPKRRRGLLGRIFRRDQEIPPAPRPRVSERELGRDVDLDANADAEFRERLEFQIRQAAGRHIRDVGVSVKGRDVRVRAMADRFWNRRMVRRAIEELPMLAGYNTDIRVE